FGPDQNPTHLVSAGRTVYVMLPSSAPDASVGQLVRVTGSTVTTSPLPDQACFDELAASSPTDLLLVCGQGVMSGAFGGRTLYGSTDSGAHWVRLPDPGEGAGYDTLGIADAGGGHAVIATSSGSGSSLLATI